MKTKHRKHTKGKWKIDQTTLYRGEEMISDEKGAFIAAIINRDESEANSKLIAAAPELLEACKLALFKIPVSITDTTNWKSIIEQAIKKAIE